MSIISFIIALPLIVIDVILYVLSFAWLPKLLSPKKMRSVQVGEAKGNKGPPRRAPGTEDGLIETNYDGDARTLYAVVSTACEKYGSFPAQVSRRFIELKKLKETDRFPTKIYDPDPASIETITYKELGRNIRNFGAGLRALGMEPIPQLKDGQTFDDAKGNFTMVLFEDTCKQWSTALHGAFSQSITAATCYATLGDDAVVSAVNETNATALLLNWKKSSKFVALADKMPSLKVIIASTYEMPAEGGNVAQGTDKVKVISTDSVMELGAKEADTFPPVPPKPHDVAIIMYTSGSTGKPKGVVMEHSSLVAAISGMRINVDLRETEEVYISYLPLAHVLALQCENALYACGTKVCYSDARQLVKALPMFAPTYHAGVPKVWEMFRDALERKLKGPVKSVFDVAYQWKSVALGLGMDTPLFNVLFRAISGKIFGGILRAGITGGGPMSADLQMFCRVCFCCPIVQGYALTETCVGGTFQQADDQRPGVQGPPVPSIEVCLQSEPDITDSNGDPYLYTDTRGSKGEPVIGRGEICFRGPSISSGYYKMPEKTKEEYDADGWFHTGDIGQFTWDGCVQIVDRKKNLVKLKGGEYVALEAMESTFVQSPFVMAVCVIANGNLDSPVALVRAEDEYLEKWAAENSVSYVSLEELGEKKETKDAIIKSMKEFGKAAKLTSLELRIKDIEVITDVEWTPGNGLTATMKIDRKKIESMHKDKVQELLKRNGAA